MQSSGLGQETTQALAQMVRNRLHRHSFLSFPSDVMVVRARLGDAFLPKWTRKANCWNICGACRYLQCGCHIRSLVTAALRQADPPISHVVLMTASTFHWDSNDGKDFIPRYLVELSEQYKAQLLLMLQTHFNLRVDDDGAGAGTDEDFVRMSTATVLLPGGGNFGLRAAEVAETFGGRLACARETATTYSTRDATMCKRYFSMREDSSVNVTACAVR